MRRAGLVLLVVLSLAAVGCGDPASGPTTSASVATTTTTAPPTTAAPTTGSVPATAVSYATTNCETPPVTFALLCDVFELIQRHHVDAPLDASALAAGAAIGAADHSPDYDGPAPESFQCAIPDDAFSSTCDELADTLSQGSFPLDEAVEDAVSSMITLSLDPFTYYVPPELAGRLTEEGIVSAVGLLLTITDPAGSLCTTAAPPCRVEVTVAVPDGPAGTAGIEAGDVLVAVDGQAVDGLGLVDIAGRLDGPAGSTVTLTILDDGEAEAEVIVEREEPTAPALQADVPAPGIGYLRIPDFDADVPGFVHDALGGLTEAGIDELVVDLRDNPGGFVDVATLVASEFLSDGLVFQSVSPDETLEYAVQEGGLATSGIGLTVVVNGGSASAAEILAGVLQERDRATIVGTPTFGKNTVQIGFPLRNDGQLRVTVARWTTPAGDSVAVDGVEPDVIVDIPADASTSDVVDLALGRT